MEPATIPSTFRVVFLCSSVRRLSVVPMALALFLALCAANAALTGAQFTCNINGYLNDCGYGPISENECRQIGCCYHEFGAGSEEPWCFFQNSDYEYCANHLYRSNCGELETTQWDCEGRGCCWDRMDPYPACFFPNSNIDQRRCDIPISAREPCGDGTNQDTCEASNCCWHPLEDGSVEPWCYQPLWTAQRRYARYRSKQDRSVRPSPLIV